MVMLFEQRVGLGELDDRFGHALWVPVRSVGFVVAGFVVLVSTIKSTMACLASSSVAMSETVRATPDVVQRSSRRVHERRRVAWRLNTKAYFE
jgi:hypothetical protein